MFRVALLSRWHVHSHKSDQRYVKELLKQPDCAVTCVWDRDERVARTWAEEYGVPYETELERVLSREDVDGVLVTSNACEHKEILIEAAKHGKHIFTEKVLSFSVEEALEIRDAIKQSGVKFCIAFTRLSIRQLAYAKQLVESGELGTPVMFRCLCGHAQGFLGELPAYWYDPTVTGGGAMIDLGFNSAYLARYIMGDIKSVSSTFTDSVLHKAVEDNASCSVLFENGAMGLIEASFTSPLMSVFELSVYGTKGAYYARFGGNDCTQLRLAGQPLQELDCKELPSAPPSPVALWVKACTVGGSDELCGIDAAVDLVKFMVAAYASAKEQGKRIAL